MINYSIKQLLRHPAKAILFLLLICVCTVLIVLGAGMSVQSAQQIRTADEEFVTIGKVTQLPRSEELAFIDDPCRGLLSLPDREYGRLLKAEDLMFEGANYIQPPERRPLYVTYQPELNLSEPKFYSGHDAVVEFRALESRDDGGPVESEITRILYQDPAGMNIELYGRTGMPSYTAQVGDRIYVCQHTDFRGGKMSPMEAGKTYVSSLKWHSICGKHGDISEYLVIDGACTSQCDANGDPVASELFPENIWKETDSGHWFQEVTEDFYEPGHAGVAWENLAKYKAEMIDHVFPVVGANRMDSLPSYYDQHIVLDSGREISQEEFDSGAKVCMMSRDLSTFSGYRVGDKISLPLMATLRGFPMGMEFYVSGTGFSPINAQGELYEPFWDEEYEIVGIFYKLGGVEYVDTNRDMFIIPEKSVGASDENNIAWFGQMRGDMDTSFIIPNGSIQEYDAALRAALPEAEFLRVEYDDKGYTQLVEGLRKALAMGLLLLGGGSLAAVAIVVLLMYFFIAREKKRTAVERSLGLSNRQCRVSLLAGIMLLTLTGTAVGSGIGCVVMANPPEVQVVELEETPDLEEIEAAAQDAGMVTDDINAEDLFDFSTAYSMWAPRGVQEPLPVIEADPLPLWMYVLIPVVLCGLVLALGLWFVSRNLKIEPIYLLSVKE